MSDTHSPDFSDRLVELCVFFATDSLTPDQQTLLDELDPHRTAREEFERVAAVLDASVAIADPIEMPPRLLALLRASAPAQNPIGKTLGRPPDDPRTTPQAATPDLQWASNPTPPNPRLVASRLWTPWLIAAASLLMAMVILLVPRAEPAPQSLTQARQELIQRAQPDSLVQWSWIVTDDPAATRGVTGDVVWSDTLNKGYMRISGLKPNDPAREQYQLWIFDASRPAGALPRFGEGLLSQRPIDGGVFDITSTGEIIIEIDAKLLVGQAAAFAVTVEPPGGVVVSDRSRVPLLAMAP